MNARTLLLRQIHPSFVQDGQPSSQAFRPTPKDEQQLSVYDGSQIEASAAWEHYTHTLKNASCGVMAVNVEECTELDLSVQPDPTPYPEHVLIGFSEHGQNAIKTKAQLLKAKALARGWLFTGMPA